jgi:FAD/FMN-containing dehydrogenase
MQSFGHTPRKEEAAGMTGLVRGALPNANEIVLSKERMNTVEEVDISAGVDPKNILNPGRIFTV